MGKGSKWETVGMDNDGTRTMCARGGICKSINVKRKLNNIVYGNVLSLNRYGNDSLEFSLIIFPHWFSLGAWWFGHHFSVMRSIMTLNLWTMGFTLNMEVFIHYH